jgi:hypothetical protein
MRERHTGAAHAAFFANVLVLSIALGGCREERAASAVVVDTPRLVIDTPRAVDSTPPRIELRPDGPVLVLTAGMERALLAAVPGFRHTSIAEYDPDLRQYVPPTERSALFAAIGDFNGDGRADVVVDGHDTTHGYQLVLFTEADSIRVFTIQKAPLPPVDPRFRRIDFVSLVPRGVIQVDTLDDDEYEKMPVQLEHDAFSMGWWEKASGLFYWRDGRFVQWTTSD